MHSTPLWGLHCLNKKEIKSCPAVTRVCSNTNSHPVSKQRKRRLDFAISYSELKRKHVWCILNYKPRWAVPILLSIFPFFWWSFVKLQIDFYSIANMLCRAAISFSKISFEINRDATFIFCFCCLLRTIEYFFLYSTTNKGFYDWSLSNCNVPFDKEGILLLVALDIFLSASFVWMSNWLTILIWQRTVT